MKCVTCPSCESSPRMLALRSLHTRRSFDSASGNSVIENGCPSFFATHNMLRPNELA